MVDHIDRHRANPSPDASHHRRVDVRFRLLGPFDVTVQDEPAQVRGPRQRIMLATLLLEHGRVVPAERIVTAMWDEHPPPTAQAQIYIAVSKLRRLLDTIGLTDTLVTHDRGYSLQVPEELVDAHVFRQLVGQGRDAARRGETAAAVTALRQGLALWRGDAVSDVPSRLVRSAALYLDEEKLAATEECLALELELGHHHEVVAELRQLVTAHPLREKGYAQLMLALYRDGRQAEALEVFRDARRVLVEEHGLDPGEELRDMERAILDADPAVTRAAPEPPPPADQPTAPRQLPASPRGFVGRSEAVATVCGALTTPPADGTSATVVVSGPGGTGKSALALHTARDVGDHFPDGQLYAHLRGSDSRPAVPEQILEQFLRAVGVAPSVIPTDDPDALASLYRSRLADSRVLIVLDDAAGSWQVQPLLPGAPGVGMVVTSRGLLASLGDVHRLDLDVLDPETSMALLCHVLGTERVDAERQEASRVATLCGHLPLALQIAAGKLAVRGHWDIARMARRLEDESRRLDELSLDGTGVRATIAVSFETLPPSARRLLLLLGAFGATDFASWAAGPLLDVDVHDGADALDELVDARLVEVHTGTGVRARYRLHELVGVYAREVLAAEIPADERSAAVERLVRCTLFLARAAHRREYGGDYTILHSTVALWELPDELVGTLLHDPIGWFTAEHVNLVTAVRLAAELRLVDVCWNLAVTAVTYFEAKLHREDWRATHEMALEAVGQQNDRYGEAALRCSRAGLALIEQRFEDATSDLETALDWFTAAGEVHGRGLAVRSLASVDRLRGQEERAEQRYRHALTDLRTVGDRVAEAHVLVNLAHLRVHRDHYYECAQLLQQALAICTEAGTRRVTAQARHQLGQLHLAHGQHEQAEAEFAEVLETTTATDDPVGQTYAWLGIGAVRMCQDDLEQARAAVTEALERAQHTGNRLLEGRAVLTLAELALHDGDRPTAARRLAYADDTFAAIGAVRWRERVEEVARLLEDSVV